MDLNGELQKKQCWEAADHLSNLFSKICFILDIVKSHIHKDTKPKWRHNNFWGHWFILIRIRPLKRSKVVVNRNIYSEAPVVYYEVMRRSHEEKSSAPDVFKLLRHSHAALPTSTLQCIVPLSQHDFITNYNYWNCICIKGQFCRDLIATLYQALLYFFLLQ